MTAAEPFPSVREEQQSWWESLLRISARSGQGVIQDHFLARNRLDNRPGSWIPAEEWDWSVRPDFRTILWNEVVFDFDYRPWSHVWSVATRLDRAARSFAMPLYWWVSAGKGLHAELFMDAGGRQNEYGWERIRRAVFDRLKETARLRTEADGHTGVDWRKVYFRDESMGSLLRMEGGLRWRKPRTLMQFEEAERFEGRLPTYKHWVAAPPASQPMLTQAWRVRYPPAGPRLWRVPESWLPAGVPEPRREVAFRRAPSSSLMVVLRHLAEYASTGHDLCDYGRFALAAHMLSYGYDVEATVALFHNCPDFNEAYSRRRVESLQRSLAAGRISLPGAAAIVKNCAHQLPELAEVR